MKTPAFTLSGTTITETKTGYVGEVKQDDNGYSVIIKKGPQDKEKWYALSKRMRNWYFYTHVQKPK
jgi:hypothetical protein